MKLQLQSILNPTAEVCQEEALYYHKTEYGRDYDGYFNLFYIEKRKAYTMIDRLFLELKLKGYTEISLFHDRERIQTLEVTCKGEDLSAGLLLELPYQQYEKGVFWFSLRKDENTPEEACSVSGWFQTELDESQIRPVRIGINICTFKREPYVTRNLTALKTRLLDKGELNVSDHLEIFVIDNGKTLKEHEPVKQLLEESGGHIHLYQNMNAGGAGGFTRGMVEILKKKDTHGLTHVLLMDDDAVVEPDTLVRIYGMLSTFREEWKDMTIGGAMLREDYPWILFCSGEYWKEGVIYNPHMHKDLRRFEEAADPYLLQTGHEYDYYSGWWCCCYSLNTVRDDNLPIPLFIHHDDIEFGQRNMGKGVVFLNGVGVWHRGAELAFPGANLYYDIRNNLIEIALHQEKNQYKTASMIVTKALVAAFFRLKYQDIRLVQKGVYDFLKGPKWLHAQNPEILNNEIRAKAHQMKPLTELKDTLGEQQYRDLMAQVKADKDKFGMDEIIDSRERKSRGRLIHYLTLDGWLLPQNKKVKAVFPTDSPFDSYRRKYVVIVDPFGEKGCLLKRDYHELGETIRRFCRTKAILRRRFAGAVRAYRKELPEITSREAWETYLNL